MLDDGEDTGEYLAPDLEDTGAGEGDRGSVIVFQGGAVRAWKMKCRAPDRSVVF